MSKTFDYVKYDDQAEATQKAFKNAVYSLEKRANDMRATNSQRLETAPMKAVQLRAAKELDENISHAKKSLQEFYMWIGKAIRDDQIVRNGNAPLQEERKDG